MNIETLLETSLDQLEKMTDNELTEHLKHYFVITRPELASKQHSNEHKIFKSPSSSYEHKIKLERAKNLAKLAGVDLGF